MTTTTTEDRLELGDVTAPQLHLTVQSRMVTAIAVFAMVIGAGSVLGGLVGAGYTWNQAAAQQIVTPDDAPFAGVAVRGPFSMWSESAIITEHQLASTGGLYYAEMDRTVPQLDDAGVAVVDAAGEAVMVPNAARASWLNATTLTTSLGLGIMAYALSAFAFVVGLTLLALGWLVRGLRMIPVTVV